MPAATESAGGLQVPRPKGRTTRRLSSHSVTKEDLADGPAIVVPPNMMDGKGGDAHELASAMELARRGIEGLTTEEDEQDDFKIEFLESKTTDKYAFAFDIDGVLIKGGDPIPEAVQAMKMLNGMNNRGIKVYVHATVCTSPLKIMLT